MHIEIFGSERQRRSWGAGAILARSLVGIEAVFGGFCVCLYRDREGCWLWPWIMDSGAGDLRDLASACLDLYLCARLHMGFVRLAMR